MATDRIFLIGVQLVYMYARAEHLLSAGDDGIGGVANHKI